MAIYSIKDLEKLSGIKAHTIRIWEQRYKLITPSRTDTNIRYYKDEELKLLLNISILNKNGYKISKIATMQKDELTKLVSSISTLEITQDSDVQLDSLTISMMEMDESKFVQIINSNIAQIGFESTMIEIIYPFLEKLSLLWLTGSISPVQENFITLIIRQQIIVAIDKLPNEKSTKALKFMTYLAEGETQELSLLFMQYLLKARGFKVLFIGANITIDDLKDAVSISKPNYLYTIFTESFNRQSVQQYIEVVSNHFADINVIFSGYQVSNQNLKVPENVMILRDLDSTLFFLNQLSASIPSKSH